MALTAASFPGPSGLAGTVDLRKDLAGTLVRDGAGIPRAGVLPRHGNAIVTARASMGVDVAAFEGALTRGGGPLFFQNDGTVTVAIGAAPASNSRIDVIYVKQNESASPFSDASNALAFGVAAGTAAASPVAPSIPTGALALANVLVPSTATTTQSSGVTITQAFPYTAMAGGVVLVRNQAERIAFAAGEGQRVHQMDVDRMYWNDGSIWHQELGSIVGVYDAPWPDAPGTYGAQNQQITAFNIPDPGVPFRAEGTLTFEGGSTSAGTRWDFHFGYGGSGNTPVTSELAPIIFTGEEAIRYRTVKSRLSDVLTGAQTWRIVSNQVYGAALGQITTAGRAMRIVYFAA